MCARAPSLPPEQRRQAVLDAVLPLVLEKGFLASTRELAATACVAEGTLFRVFESKDDLVVAAARSAFRRTDHLDELAAIDPGLPLDQRLEAAVRIWQDVARRMVQVFGVLHAAPEGERPHDPRTLIDNTVVARAEELLADLLRPDAGRLRLPVPEVIRVLGGLVLASVHPAQIGLPLTPEGLVDLLLHGVLTDAAALAHPITP